MLNNDTGFTVLIEVVNYSINVIDSMQDRCKVFAEIKHHKINDKGKDES